MLDIPQYDPHSPKKVDDIVGNAKIWSSLAQIIRNDTSPHIVLAGPSGCGKSLFLRILLEIECKRPLLSIDCTANSGLRDLRDSLRGFSRGSRTNDGHYRWIMLEHADSLAADTQAFLRRMMETTSNTTRMIFECRDAGAIAEPILSRSSLFTVNTPDETEIRYELMRRTEYMLSDIQIKCILQISNGNMRKALIHALSSRWISDKNSNHFEQLEKQLLTRPTCSDSKEWMEWAIQTEQFCKNNGYDLRDILQIGWPNNSHVFYICSQWSRLGGISPRTLFFNCIHQVITSA
jgi:DNA polymerase III delta prime subunit